MLQKKEMSRASSTRVREKGHGLKGPELATTPMQKTFPLTHPRIKPERQVDAIKGEITKYLKRERKKPVPAEADFWDFNCAFGASPESKEVVHVSQIFPKIDDAAAKEWKGFYLEILAEAKKRNPKEIATQPPEDPTN